jgi:hypothetical protein
LEHGRLAGWSGLFFLASFDFHIHTETNRLWVIYLIFPVVFGASFDFKTKEEA